MRYFTPKNKQRQNANRGQAVLVIVIMCTAIFSTIVLGIVDPVVNELQLSSNLLSSKASLYAAESSIEDATLRVKSNMIINYSLPISLAIGGYNATTNISNTDGIKTIDAIGSDTNNFRKIQTKIVSGVGANFYYGSQTGSGGLSLSGNSQINGSIYSNGSVESTSGATVTGSVTAANSSIGGGSYVGAINVGTTGVGDAWAHSVTGANVQGKIYCQTGDKTSNYNNKDCDTSRGNPPIQNLPITDADIATWKNYALASTTHSGNYHVDSDGATIGPMKITGNLTVDGGGTLTLTGTVWVQGSITFTGGGKLRLDPEYGVSGGVLISDGLVTLTGNSDFDGSGQTGSYPLIITTSNSDDAISVTGGSGAIILVAQSGTISLSGGAMARSLIANRIVVGSGGTVTYDPNLANFNFSSGPSGSWNISSWREVP